MLDQETGASGGRRRRRGGGGGSESRRSERTSAAIEAWPVLNQALPTLNVLSEEGLSLIEENADKILAEVGLDIVDDPAALDIWRDAGAEVDGERVRFPKGLLRKLCSTAPREFTQIARNPNKNVIVGGKRTIFAPVYGPPFYRDMESGRRYATLEDFQNLVKLTYMMPALHHSGGTVCEPVDVPVNKRHLDMTYSHVKYSDKPIMGNVTAPERAQDTVDMMKILHGADVVDSTCTTVSLINVNSPMTYDSVMNQALKVYAENNQACIVSPFIIAGAMSPVTAAGTMTQALAEALVGIAYGQLIRPGSPVIFGTFAASMNMMTGAPTFGTPEPAHVLLGMAALARRLGVPFRSGGGLCASKMPDAQAAYESMQTLYPTVMAGTNFVLHSAGWLEGGLVSCPEKLIMDADQLAMLQIFQGGIDLTENGQALDAIQEAGPGQHYLGTAHTQRNFETAFYRSPNADSNSYEQWLAEGEKDAFARAHDRFKKLMAEYQAPALDQAKDEELLAFMAKRKESMPDQEY